MQIQLSDHFTYRRLLRFTLPSIVMMIFSSIYSVVDGLFVSNFVGSNALSSINIIMPLIMLPGAFGFMLGTGGSAEVAKTIGEGKSRIAKRYFTMLVLTIVTLGVLFAVVGVVFIRPISHLLGASEILMEDCVIYGIILLVGSPAFMLQTTFQTFFVVAERPKVGLILTIASGITNIFLDFLFVYLLKWGIAGAAFATVCGYAVGGIIPLFYFRYSHLSKLHFTRTKLYPTVLLHSCINGASEMLSTISMSVVTFLYNFQMMRLFGEDGVAAISVIMYVSFIFVAISIGFSLGSAPIFGYHYGAGNHTELKNMFHKSLVIVAFASVIMTFVAEIGASHLVALFVGRGNELSKMTVRGLQLYSLSFLICGFNIFSSAFFTALCNGRISAVISVLRALILQAIMMLFLPELLGLDGVWISAATAELLTLVVTVSFLIKQRKRYHYA